MTVISKWYRNQTRTHDLYTCTHDLLTRFVLRATQPDSIWNSCFQNRSNYLDASSVFHLVYLA